MQTDLVYFVAFFACIIVFYFLVVRRGRVPQIRHIPALDAFEEMIGRAAELNRPVVATTGSGSGWGGLYTAQSVTTLAALSLLSKVCTLAARYKVDLIFTAPMPEIMGLVQETFENAYRAEGALDRFDPVQQIHCESPYIYSWESAYMDIILKNRVAANFLLASVAGTSWTICETGTRVGAIQFESVRGTGGTTAFTAIMCDHITIGPEALAIGAIATGEAEQIGTIVGNDLLNIFLIGMTLFGTALANANNKWLANLLKL